MSDLDEPLSATEAARVLSEARWGRSDEQSQMPVSDGADLLTGHAGVEASQGFEAMTVANPIQKELDPEPVDGVELGKKILAFEAQVAEPVERSYRQIGGPNDGAPVPENRTVSAEQAAHDVARARESDLNALESWEAKQVQEAIDALRAGTEPAQEQVSRSFETQQPETQPVQSTVQQPAAQTDDGVVKILQSNPRLLSAINEQMAQHSAQTEQATRAYVNATAANAQSAYANLLASFPELQGVRPEGIPTALQVLAQSQPQRAQQIAGHIQRVTQLTQEAMKAQQAEAEKQAQYRQLLWNYDAKQADDQFDAWANEAMPGQAEAVKNETFEMLSEYGLSRDQIAYHWNTNPLFRSFPAQRLMADAARYRLAQKQIQQKAQRPAVPTVQRPGSPLQRDSEQEWNDRNLNERIDRSTGRDQIRAAAELIAQRRLRNGR